MVSEQTRQEMEDTLGQVPDWMGVLSEPAADHSWGIFRDLGLGETELSAREKALVGVGAAAVMKCPYCTYFHREEARLADVTDVELKEAVNVAGDTAYFSTLLHGNEVDEDHFIAETDEIFDYVRDQEPAPADD
ncbi:carboxymuconolactone decarboxylase family protein [Halomicrobium salinisoli]|uniref:carboxymuconolactone decarboxylase family protein n=1 Tax=Halomicrobium salinisoli TaxID=2878391 RepID=UPI001CF035D7|nr:carboxymuconolactone decarboxylase family protein [Halomicrobium salinisoli]